MIAKTEYAELVENVPLAAQTEDEMMDVKGTNLFLQKDNFTFMEYYAYRISSLWMTILMRKLPYIMNTVKSWDTVQKIFYTLHRRDQLIRADQKKILWDDKKLEEKNSYAVLRSTIQTPRDFLLQ